MLPGLWLPLYIENIFKTAIKFILPYFLDRNAFKYHCKILTDDLNRVNSKEIVSILLYGYDFFVCVLGYTDEGLRVYGRRGKLPVPFGGVCCLPPAGLPVPFR